MGDGDWSRVLFSEICDYTTGKLNSNQAEDDGEYPFFTCSPEILKINNYAFDQDAVLLAGNNANGIFHLKRYSGKFNAYQRTYVINSKDINVVNNKFIYYQLSLKLNLLKEVSLGTATRFLTKTILDKIEFDIPNKCEMEFIADTLSCLDDKIELNNHINKILEEMAQAIFKSWFVDFEPFQDGEFEDSELGRIPKGWRVGTLGEILTLNYGKSLTAKNRIDGKIRVYSSAGITGFHNQALVNEPSIIVGRKGTIGTVYYSTEPSFCIDTAYYATQRDSKFPLLLMYQRLKEIKLNQYNEDSAVPGLNRNTVYDIKIIIPPEEIVNQYEEILTSIYNLNFGNAEQTQVLTDIRDSLLPKLMSGEIRVPIKEASGK